MRIRLDATRRGSHVVVLEKSDFPLEELLTCHEGYIPSNYKGKSDNLYLAGAFSSMVETVNSDIFRIHEITSFSAREDILAIAIATRFDLDTFTLEKTLETEREAKSGLLTDMLKDETVENVFYSIAADVRMNKVTLTESLDAISTYHRYYAEEYPLPLIEEIKNYRIAQEIAKQLNYTPHGAVQDSWLWQLATHFDEDILPFMWLTRLQSVKTLGFVRTVTAITNSQCNTVTEAVNYIRNTPSEWLTELY